MDSRKTITTGIGLLADEVLLVARLLAMEEAVGSSPIISSMRVSYNG